MRSKDKGAIAELAVAAHLASEGFEILFPYGDKARYDMVVEREGRFYRIQCKSISSADGVWKVKTFSANYYVKNLYTSVDVDVIAVYDTVTKGLIFIPAMMLGTGRHWLHFREEKARNGQTVGINMVSDFRDVNRCLG